MRGSSSERSAELEGSAAEILVPLCLRLHFRSRVVHNFSFAQRCRGQWDGRQENLAKVQIILIGSRIFDDDLRVVCKHGCVQDADMPCWRLVA